jgi:hypothetical protein
MVYLARHATARSCGRLQSDLMIKEQESSHADVAVKTKVTVVREPNQSIFLSPVGKFTK